MDQLMLKAFPFTLKTSAKTWLLGLPAGSVSSWVEMKKLFLMKYYPLDVSVQRKRELRDVVQDAVESFSEFWERYKRKVADCPYHGYDKSELVMFFVQGLSEEGWRMLNAASQGGIMNKTV